MKRIHALPALMVGLLALAGCGQDNPVTTNNSPADPAAGYASASGVQTEVQALPGEFEFDTYDDGLSAKPELDPGLDFEPLSTGGDLGTLEAIDPGFWFRKIQRHERRYVVEIEEPDTLTRIARVRVIDRLAGTFNVVTRPDTIDGEVIERSMYSKPLLDTAVRKAVFVRHRCVDGDRDRDADDSDDDEEDDEDGYRDGWTRWRLRAISGTEVTSDNGTRQIQSVRLRAGDMVDVTVTDPLELRNVRQELLHLPPASPVEVTVQTADASDVVVLYTRWGRKMLRRGDDGLARGRFMTPAELGMRHVAVNTLSHGTLFDDRAPYDSKAWGIPYVVAPPLTAQQ